METIGSGHGDRRLGVVAQVRRRAVAREDLVKQRREAALLVPVDEGDAAVAALTAGGFKVLTRYEKDLRPFLPATA